MTDPSQADGEPNTGSDEANLEPVETAAAHADTDIGALIDRIQAAGTISGVNRVAGVTVVERYATTGRVRVVDVAGRALTDNQYRKFLALRRNELQTGSSEGDIRVGDLADAVLAASETRSARSIPGAVVLERDQFNRPRLWSIAGREISQGQYVKLRKAYFAGKLAA